MRKDTNKGALYSGQLNRINTLSCGNLDFCVIAYFWPWTNFTNCFRVFIIKLKQISHIPLISLLLTLNKFQTLFFCLYCYLWAILHILPVSLSKNYICNVNILLNLNKFHTLLYCLFWYFWTISHTVQECLLQTWNKFCSSF